MAISCRPDISYAVGRLSRHMHTPTDAAIQDCAHLLGYMNCVEHRGLGLFYSAAATTTRNHFSGFYGLHQNGVIRGIHGSLTDVHSRSREAK